MTKPPFPRLCRDCRHASPDGSSTWNLKCHHPVVNARDPWALAAADVPHRGTDCRGEREKRWPAACGMRGALWEVSISDPNSMVAGRCGLIGCLDPTDHKHCPSMIQPHDPFNEEQQANKSAQEFEDACIAAYIEGYNRRAKDVR